MNQSQDDMVETLLRKQFEGPVHDGGFSERLMQRLPQRRRRAAWPVWGGMLAGVAACWLALGASPLMNAGWHDWVGGHWTVPAIAILAVVLGMTLLALAWGVAEADDR